MRDKFVTRFMKGVVSTGIGTLATILIGFINVLVAVRYVTTAEFGAYILIQVIAAFFMMISDMGVNNSVTRFIAGGGVEQNRATVDTMLCYKLATAAGMAMVILISGRPLELLFGPGPLSGMVALIALLFVCEILNAYFAAVVQGLHMYRILAGSQVMLSLLNLGLTVAFVVFLGMGVAGLIYARAISLCASVIYQVSSMPFNPMMRFDRDTFRGVFRFGFPLGLNSALTFVFTRIDTLIIGAMLSPVGVAYYGVASKLPNSGRQMFQSFRAVYFPSISELFNRGETADAERVMNRSLRAVGFVCGLATLVAFLFRDGIVVLLFSEAYAESAPVLSMLMLALGIGLVGNVLGTTLVGAGYSKLPVVINIVDATVNVAANILFLPVFGIMGAAYAALIARAATNPVNVWFLVRSGIRVDVTEYLKPFGALIVCMALGSLADGADWIVKLIIIGLFVAACRTMSVFTERDITAVIRGLGYRSKHIGTAGA